MQIPQTAKIRNPLDDMECAFVVGRHVKPLSHFFEEGQGPTMGALDTKGNELKKAYLQVKVVTEGGAKSAKLVAAPHDSSS